MDYTEIAAAGAQAKNQLTWIDRQISAMLGLCAGRLQASHRSGWARQADLRALKNELRRYNPHTDTWRD